MTCKCEDPYCETRDCKTNNYHLNRLVNLIETVDILAHKGSLIEDLIGCENQEKLAQILELVQNAALQEIGQIEYDRLSGKSNLA